jgi:hypothetical protein
LKPNDYIMSHDYFKFDNCWKPEHPPWDCEITDIDIKDAVKRNKLQKKYSNLFEHIFWCCFKK